ncbi:hypothetical protein OMES3154_00306 [Oceanivirga miroungae]|uniref:DHFR domain-containing protein n=2 Tax=Oceanivirga miroungae TaxID=1130046 RepID=A0A6I8MD56_9FUSO|nr:hypothetical protein OMES3154_00306 [Oceanivirga miroungae]
MIVCITKDNLMGSKNAMGNGLLWDVKEELNYFKEKTMGHSLLFGVNTSKYVPIDKIRKTRDVYILDYSVDVPKLIEKLEGENKEIFICGGYNTYKYFLEKYIPSEIYVSILKDHVLIKESENKLYFPKLEEYGYKKEMIKEYDDFYAYVYKN